MARANKETNAAEQEQSMKDAADDADNNNELMAEYSADVGTQEAPVPLPARDYEAVIRKVEKKQSDKGNEYYAVSLYVAPEQYPHDYVEGDPDGTTLIYRRLGIKDTHQGRYAMRRWYEALGLPAPGRKINPMDWYDKRVKLTVTQETYEGEPRAQAARVSKL